MPSLDDLYVDGNKFVGTIPEDICTDQVNADFIIDLYDQDTQTEIDNCYKISCPTQMFSVEGVWPCMPCETGTVMPYLGGEKRCFPRDSRQILQNFFAATNGQSWSTPNNWFHEGSDLCSFTGVSCNEDGHVISISLKKSGLSGAIPPDIGFLEHLQKLDLSDNSLTGFLPSDLQWTEIEDLDISGNLLRGPVPPMLCKDEGINENGLNNVYHCDFIACAPGTASPIGRKSLEQEIACTPCSNGANILGLRGCKTFHPVVATGTWYETAQSNRTAEIILLCFAVLGVAVAVIHIRRKKNKHVHEKLPSDLSSVVLSRKDSEWSGDPRNQHRLV
jgi:Leucine-rich repeat (LRR) protein